MRRLGILAAAIGVAGAIAWWVDRETVRTIDSVNRSYATTIRVLVGRPVVAVDPPPEPAAPPAPPPPLLAELLAAGARYLASRRRP